MPEQDRYVIGDNIHKILLWIGLLFLVLMALQQMLARKKTLLVFIIFLPFIIGASVRNAKKRALGTTSNFGWKMGVGFLLILISFIIMAFGFTDIGILSAFIGVILVLQDVRK